MDNTKPIGVFDSGLGGLTVVKELIKVLPNENIIYLGDTARVPYGTRSGDIVKKFSLEDAKFLLEKDVKLIVIACNTASAFAGKWLKEKISIPVFEVISSAAETAVNNSKTKKIGVVATRGTISSGAYETAIRRFDKSAEVKSVPCPLFVPFIEEGESDSPALRMVAEKYLNKFKEDKPDTLILGCTHYPIIREIIQDILSGENISFVDPGVEEALKVKSYLKENKMLNNSKSLPTRRYYVTDYTERFIKVAEMFLGDTIHGNLEKAALINEK